MHKVLLSFVLLSLLACEGNTAARKAARGPNFVADPDHIYFKNVRARHYRAEEVAQRATIYQHDELFDSEARLRPILIDNWLQDRAIIRFETKPELANWRLETAADGQWKPFALSTPPDNDELALLSDYLLGKGDLRITSRSDTLRAFPGEAGRSEARIVLNDFLRMVGYKP